MEDVNRLKTVPVGKKKNGKRLAENYIKMHDDIIKTYIDNSDKSPLFLQGDALEVLKSMPDECIDCVVTSPPYWGKRQYSNGGIGQENSYVEYIDNLMNISLGR